MVSTISGANPAPAMPIRAESPKAQETASAAADVSTPEAQAPGMDTGQSAQTAATARVGGQLTAQLDASRVSSSSESASTDYIAEADTDNDRKVSEQESIAYAKKQASEAERSREQEVQRAYLPQEEAGTQLDISA